MTVCHCVRLWMPLSCIFGPNIRVFVTNPWVEKLWFHVPPHLPTTYILDDCYIIEEYIVPEGRT